MFVLFSCTFSDQSVRYLVIEGTDEQFTFLNEGSGLEIPERLNEVMMRHYELDHVKHIKRVRQVDGKMFAIPLYEINNDL